jgi:hypothetical protein
MLEREHVLARGLEADEPVLTVGVLLDSAATIGHVFGPCTWWQLTDYRDALVRVWSSTRRRDARRMQQVVTLDWAGKLSLARAGRIDIPKAYASLRSVSQDRKGGWHGYMPLIFAKGIDAAHKELISNSSFPLSWQAAVAATEASLVTVASFENGHRPPAPPHQDSLRPLIDWLSGNWQSLVRDGLANDAATAPWWWFETWSTSTRITVKWLESHLCLVSMCIAISPSFRAWWDEVLAEVEAQKQMVRRREAEARRQSELARRGYSQAVMGRPRGIPSPYAIADTSGVLAATSMYRPGRMVDYSGTRWWEPPRQV